MFYRVGVWFWAVKLIYWGPEISPKLIVIGVGLNLKRFFWLEKAPKVGCMRA